MRRDLDDLHAVKPEHITIHERLVNWGAYVRERPSLPAVQPMFKMYRPYLVPRESSPGVAPDPHDAMTIERTVAKMPERHAFVLRWVYVYPWRDVQKIRRVLGATTQDLRSLVSDSRAMLNNRQSR